MEGRLTTRLMTNTLRAGQLIARHPGLTIILAGDHDALGLYEARVNGQLAEVDADLGVLLDLLEARERTVPRVA